MRALDGLCVILVLAAAQNALALPWASEDGDVLLEVHELSAAEGERGTEKMPKRRAAAKNVTAAHFTSPVAAGGTEPIFYQGSGQDEERDIGEMVESMSSDDAEKAALKIQKRKTSDKTNAGLFDLVPVYKGILADPQRRKGLANNCVNSMKLWVDSLVCKRKSAAKMLPANNVTAVKFPKSPGTGSGSGSGSAMVPKSLAYLTAQMRLGNSLHLDRSKKSRVKATMAAKAKAKAKGSAGAKDPCRAYAIKPMSAAMRAIWGNVKRSFCSNKKCDATLCYLPPGPIGSNGYPKKNYHTFSQVPLNVLHKSRVGKTIVQQLANIDMTLEKMSLCEKLSPAAVDKSMKGYRKPGTCKVARRCRIIRVKYGECLDGARGSKAVMDCPRDAGFKKKLLQAQIDFAMMTCNRM